MPEKIPNRHEVLRVANLIPHQSAVQKESNITVGFVDLHFNSLRRHKMSAYLMENSASRNSQYQMFPNRLQRTNDSVQQILSIRDKSSLTPLLENEVKDGSVQCFKAELFPNIASCSNDNSAESYLLNKTAAILTNTSFQNQVHLNKRGIRYDSPYSCTRHPIEIRNHCSDQSQRLRKMGLVGNMNHGYGHNQSLNETVQIMNDIGFLNHISPKSVKCNTCDAPQRSMMTDEVRSSRDCRVHHQMLSQVKASKRDADFQNGTLAQTIDIRGVTDFKATVSPKTVQSNNWNFFKNTAAKNKMNEVDDYSVHSNISKYSLASKGQYGLQNRMLKDTEEIMANTVRDFKCHSQMLLEALKGNVGNFLLNHPNGYEVRTTDDSEAQNQASSEQNSGSSFWNMMTPNKSESTDANNFQFGAMTKTPPISAQNEVSCREAENNSYRDLPKKVPTNRLTSSGNNINPICGDDMQERTNGNLRSYLLMPNSNKQTKRDADAQTGRTIWSPENRKNDFECFQCKSQFFSWISFKDHISKHSKSRKCGYCGKWLVSTESLAEHIRRIHVKIKPFNCSVCNKAFAAPGDVKKHMRTHTGECNVYFKDI